MIPTLDISTTQFLSALFPGIPDGSFIETRVLSGGEIVDNGWYDTATACVAACARHADPGALVDCYFGVGLRGARGAGSDSDIVHLPALWAEIDSKNFESRTLEEAWSLVERLGTPPSIVVCSGNGFHLYWLLNHYIGGHEDLELAVAIMRGIRSVLGASTVLRPDPVYNLSRILRLPNTYNHKSSPPRRATVTLYEPSRRYTLTELSEFAPPEMRESSHGQTDYHEGDFEIDTGLDVRECIARLRASGVTSWIIDAINRPDLYDNGDESRLDWAICLELVQYLSLGEVEYIWLNTPWGNRDKVRRRSDYRRRTIYNAFLAYQERPAESMTEDTGGTSASLSIVPYVWRDNGTLVYTGGRGDLLLTNFKPELLRQVEIIDADGETHYEYDVRFSRSESRVKTVRLSQDEIENDAGLRHLLASILPADFLVYPSGWQHLSTAIFALALDTDYSRERTYSAMGWADDNGRPVFILPGAEGGITAQGLDTRYRLDETAFKALPDRIRLYGLGVRPIVSDEDRARATAAFTALLDCGDTEMIAPILVHVMAGPLSPFGMRRTPPVVHVLGRTGSFKTTITTIALSIFGSFDGQRIPESWASTQNAILRRLYEVRDLTLLVDDYKTSARGDPALVIQTYADGTARSRMAATQENRVSLVPRGLLLSTGEDVWEEHESTNARTLEVLINRPVPEDLPEFLGRLSVAQQHARDGDLALVGGTWLMHLAAQPPGSVEQRFTTAWDEQVRALSLEAGSTTHPRRIASLASVRAAALLIRDFVAECLPDALISFENALSVAIDSLTREAQASGEEAAAREALTWTLDVITQALHAGEVRFIHRLSNEEDSLGARYAQPIGYYDEENIYITKSRTWDWLLVRARRAGVSLHFSWSALMHEIQARFGPYLTRQGNDARTSYLTRVSGAVVRSAVIPQSAFGYTQSEVSIAELFEETEGSSAAE